MKSLQINELPNFDDGATKDIGFRVQRARSLLLEAATSVLDQNARAVNSAPVIVVAGVFHRLAECSLSLELLASKGFLRDVAVLLVTLIELRLDLQYISLSPERAREWLDHTALGRKPWRVSQQLKEVFSDVQERDAEAANYRTFSMVKHGNPAGGSISLPLGVREEGLVLPDSNEKAHLLPTYLYAAGTQLCSAWLAGGDIVSSVGLDLSAQAEHTRQISAEMSRLLHMHVLSLIRGDPVASRGSENTGKK